MSIGDNNKQCVLSACLFNLKPLSYAYFLEKVSLRQLIIPRKNYYDCSAQRQFLEVFLEGNMVILEGNTWV